jgi:hypothetical protein
MRFTESNTDNLYDNVGGKDYIWYGYYIENSTWKGDLGETLSETLTLDYVRFPGLLPKLQ